MRAHVCVVQMTALRVILVLRKQDICHRCQKYNNSGPHKALSICVHGKLQVMFFFFFFQKTRGQPVMPFLDEHQAALPAGRAQCRTGIKEVCSIIAIISTAALFC